MKTVKWGIIGCGDVAEIKSGPAFQNIPNSELIAVMRRNGAKAKDFAVRHKVPYHFDKAQDLLNHKDITAVYIATPPSTHLEYTLMALDAGKNVYLEKPMTLNVTQAKSIIQALKETSCKLTVAHYRRNLPAFKKVKELLDQETIGAVRNVDIQILQPKKSNIIAKTEHNWRLDPKVSGGGYFYDIGPHQIDLMYFYFGAIKAVAGFTSSENALVEDIVNGIISFENGIQFRGIWNFIASAQDQKDTCAIYGSEGSIHFSFYGEEVQLKNKKGVQVFPFKNPKHVQQPMIAAVVDYFLGKGQNPCPAEDGLLVMQTMEQLCGRS